MKTQFMERVKRENINCLSELYPALIYKLRDINNNKGNEKIMFYFKPSLINEISAGYNSTISLTFTTFRK